MRANNHLLKHGQAWAHRLVTETHARSTVGMQADLRHVVGVGALYVECFVVHRQRPVVAAMAPDRMVVAFALFVGNLPAFKFDLDRRTVGTTSVDRLWLRQVRQP